MIKFLLFLLFSSYITQFSCSAAISICDLCNILPKCTSNLISISDFLEFVDEVLLTRPNPPDIIDIANETSPNLRSLVYLMVCNTLNSNTCTLDSAKFYTALLDMTWRVATTTQPLPCSKFLQLFEEASKPTPIEVLVNLQQQAVNPNPFYTRGSCAADHVNCDPVMAVSEFIGTSPAPIISMNYLKSQAFSGLVAHKDGTLEFINCYNTPVLSTENDNSLLWTWSLPLKSAGSSLLSLNASVADEKTFYLVGFPMTMTMIAARYAEFNPSTGLSSSGLMVIISISSPSLGLISVHVNGPYIDRVTVNQLSLEVDRVSHTLYYLGSGGDSSPNDVYLAQVQGFELIGSVLKALRNPDITTLSQFESTFTTNYLYEERQIFTFQVCDCKIAVGYIDGSIKFYCCQTLQPTGCIIYPMCSRRCHAIPVKIKWCCLSKTLVVLYSRHKNDSSKHRGRTFIRVYSVDFEKLNNYYHSEDLCECVEHLYSIRECECEIANFAICCGPCPVIYALITNNRNWYVRSYYDGRMMATARLEGNVANGLIASSSCKVGHKCKCCKCGVFIPFDVPIPSTVVPELISRRETLADQGGRCIKKCVVTCNVGEGCITKCTWSCTHPDSATQRVQPVVCLCVKNYKEKEHHREEIH